MSRATWTGVVVTALTGVAVAVGRDLVVSAFEDEEAFV
jgi:hypothetical protein